MSRLYVYCLCDADANLAIESRAVANLEASIEFINIGPVGALVSAIDEDEVLPVRRNMMAHTKTLEAAMAETTILPMQFGVIVDDAATLGKIVSAGQDQVLMEMEKLRDHFEAGLKLIWDEQVVFQEIASTDPALQAASKRLAQKSEAETYYERIELGRKVDAAMQKMRASEAARFQSLVSEFAGDVKVLDQPDDMTICNLAALVSNDQMAALEKALEAFDESEGERMTIRFVAPVPAYNFINLRLDFERPDAREEAA